MAVGMVEGEG